MSEELKQAILRRERGTRGEPEEGSTSKRVRRSSVPAEEAEVEPEPAAPEEDA
jgi:hypothetical protein